MGVLLGWGWGALARANQGGTITPSRAVPGDCPGKVLAVLGPLDTHVHTHLFLGVVRGQAATGGPHRPTHSPVHRGLPGRVPMHSETGTPMLTHAWAHTHMHTHTCLGTPILTHRAHVPGYAQEDTDTHAFTQAHTAPGSLGDAHSQQGPGEPAQRDDSLRQQFPLAALQPGSFPAAGQTDTQHCREEALAASCPLS